MPGSYMAVYKRGKTWWYEFVFQGKRIQESAKTRNIKTARKVEAAHKTRLAEARFDLKPSKGPAPTLKDYAPRFKEHIRVRVESKQTISFYEEKLRRLLESRRLAALPLDEIDEDAIDAYVRRRLKQVSLTSVNRELATLRRLLRVAQRTHKLIPTTPTIQLLSGEEGRDFVLSYQMEADYLAIISGTLRDFAVLSLDTGVRAGEGLALKWVDVHLTAAHGATLGHIRIRKGKTRNSARFLSITPRVHAMLKTRREFFPKAVFVFQSVRKKDAHVTGWSLDHLHAAARTKFKDRYGREAPAEFVVHSFRHTFGTRLGEAGADAFTIMRIMGHSSVTVSQKYVHPTPESLERAFERLDKLNRERTPCKSPDSEK